MSDTVTTSYLGFPLEIGEQQVTVFEPLRGRRLGTVRSVKQARLFVRGYRKASKEDQ